MANKSDGKRLAEDMDTEELVAMLENAKKRVIYIEKLLSQRSWTPCDHELVDIFPAGMRDNGEHWIECSKCGERM